MKIGQAFNQTTQYYDEWIQKAMANYELVFSTAVELVPFDTDTCFRVMDLGAGTGLFSYHLMARFPQAHFTLFDLAEQMLDVARQRFAATPERFEYIVDDYRNLGSLPPYELIISSMSIHHLADPEKSSLFKAIYNMLKPGGVFINVDQIQAPTPTLRELYWNSWLKRLRTTGQAEERIQSSIQRRTTYDKDALLADQLRWLAEAGFANADIIYKFFHVGVFLATK